MQTGWDPKHREKSSHDQRRGLISRALILLVLALLLLIGGYLMPAPMSIALNTIGGLLLLGALVSLVMMERVKH